MTARMPNFLVIGAARSGTTSLYCYLKEHPQVFMSSPKEPHYFVPLEDRVHAGPGDQVSRSRLAARDINQYQSLFQGASSEKALGEASVWYLYHPEAAKRIKETLPGAKLIVVLPNPL